MLIPVYFLWHFKTGLLKPVLIGTVRMIIQLFLIGAYLRFLFEWNNPFINFLWVIIMVGVAAETALTRTREQTGTHLPPHNICPLVTQDRQVTIGINPVLICTPNDCLRCRADNQFFFQFGSRIYDNTRTVLCILQTVVSNYSTLFGKSFYVLSFTAKVRFRDKQRGLCCVWTLLKLLWMKLSCWDTT